MKLLRRIWYYFASSFRILFSFKQGISVLLALIFKNDKTTKVVTLRRPLLKFVTRGGMDIWSIKETIFDAFYTRYGVPVRDGWTVLDIGAGIGDFCVYAVYGNPNTMVFAYEPFPESYQLLVRNINLNGFDNVVPVRSAVWSTEGILRLDLSSGEPLKIISMAGDDPEEVSEVAKVQAVTLDQIFQEYAFDHLDLIKLDCEGAEYEILMKASAEVFDKIDRIIMEYHDIDQEHDHNRLASFLELKGYHVSCYANFIHGDIGYLYAQQKEMN